MMPLDLGIGGVTSPGRSPQWTASRMYVGGGIRPRWRPGRLRAGPSGRPAPGPAAADLADASATGANAVDADWSWRTRRIANLTTLALRSTGTAPARLGPNQ